MRPRGDAGDESTDPVAAIVSAVEAEDDGEGSACSIPPRTRDIDDGPRGDADDEASRSS